MASSGSFQKAQIPVGCGLCEGGSKIQWKCCDCVLLMCTRCKEKVHAKFKNGNDHRIVNIKDVGQHDTGDTITVSDINCQQHEDQPFCSFCKNCPDLVCDKCIPKIQKGHDLLDEKENGVKCEEVRDTKTITDKLVSYWKNISETIGQLYEKYQQLMYNEKEFKVIKQFTSDLNNIHITKVGPDGSLWIGDISLDLLQHIQIKGNKIQVLLRLNTVVYDMAVTPGDELLVCAASRVKQVSRIGEIKDTPYSVAPLEPIAIHVTSNYTVIIGAITPGSVFPATGRCVVYMMDRKGKHLAAYEQDGNNKPLFTYPARITSTCEGNICVIDRFDSKSRGTVVVLSPTGYVINIYSGHSDIYNNKKPFTPTDIITTTLNSIIVVDMDSHTLHILDSDGYFITHYYTEDLDIIHPFSVALSTTGNLFIGCVPPDKSRKTYKSKLYELEYPGF